MPPAEEFTQRGDLPQRRRGAGMGTAQPTVDVSDSTSRQQSPPSAPLRLSGSARQWVRPVTFDI